MISAIGWCIMDAMSVQRGQSHTVTGVCWLIFVQRMVLQIREIFDRPEAGMQDFDYMDIGCIFWYKTGQNSVIAQGRMYFQDF